MDVVDDWVRTLVRQWDIRSSYQLQVGYHIHHFERRFVVPPIVETQSQRPWIAFVACLLRLVYAYSDHSYYDYSDGLQRHSWLWK